MMLYTFNTVLYVNHIAINLGKKRETILTVKITVNWGEKILEIDSGDGCTTLNVINATKFYVRYILPQ